MDSTIGTPAGTDPAAPSEPRPGGGTGRRPAHRFNGRFGWVAAVLWCLVLGCTSCAGAGGGSAVIGQADLVGDWGNAAGARLHVSADHTLTWSGILNAVPDYECSTGVAGGGWKFLVSSDPSGDVYASDSATAGDSFTVSTGRHSQVGCDLDAKVQYDDDGYNLCLVRDFDQTCTSGELLRRSSTQTDDGAHRQSTRPPEAAAEGTAPLTHDG
ncbi:hypothetical protein GCM10009663_28280 [Kitasatospora arboriphila]|uniref:Uncharacterized protein n=2 Tax=Kitasatospora arboriphila TaxID=258052 RepID=A0ABN1TJ17_9ACTN